MNYTSASTNISFGLSSNPLSLSLSAIIIAFKHKFNTSASMNYTSASIYKFNAHQLIFIIHGFEMSFGIIFASEYLLVAFSRLCRDQLVGQSLGSVGGAPSVGSVEISWWGTLCRISWWGTLCRFCRDQAFFRLL